MEIHADALEVYRDLAKCYEERGDIPMRDRFIILAADAAVIAGQVGEAERLREQLLRISRHHMLRGYTSFVDARATSDVQTYIRDLHANYPLSAARDLLESLRNGTARPNSESDRPLNNSIQWNDLDAMLASQLPGTGSTVPLPYSETVPGAPIPPAQKPDRLVPTKLMEPIPIAPPVKPPAQPRPRQAPGTQASPPTHRETASTRPVRRAIPRTPVTTPQTPADSPFAGGSWLGMLLSVLVFLVGVALLAFTLGRPFWEH
jgi:hypothetical protein